MASLHKRHEDFIREMRASLRSSDQLKKRDVCSPVSSHSDESPLDKQLMEKLQKKFDELFGPDDD